MVLCRLRKVIQQISSTYSSLELVIHVKEKFYLEVEHSYEISDPRRSQGSGFES
jgi:hypothetical protein